MKPDDPSGALLPAAVTHKALQAMQQVPCWRQLHIIHSSIQSAEHFRCMLCPRHHAGHLTPWMHFSHLMDTLRMAKHVG